MRNKIISIFILFLSAPAIAEDDLPLWEAGAGIGFATLPDYPASDQDRTFTIPFPVAIYRGKYLRADDEGGVRGEIHRDPFFDFNISFGGNFARSSEDNIARSGMEDLDFLAEVGPSLVLKFLGRERHAEGRLHLNLSLRFATSIAFPGTQERGLIFDPFLFYRKNNFLIPNLRLFVGIDSMWASRKYGEFFYSVEEQDVLSNREFFRGRGGYFGTRYWLGISYLLQNTYSFIIGMNYADNRRAANEESPLFRTNYNFSSFIGLVFWLYESDRKESEARL